MWLPTESLVLAHQLYLQIERKGINHVFVKESVPQKNASVWQQIYCVAANANVKMKNVKIVNEANFCTCSNK